MYQGEKIYLTALEKEDLPKLMVWRNNINFRKHFREYREINTSMQNSWFENKVLADPSTIMFAIRLVSDDSLVGCCGLCYINWVQRNADLSLYIGYKDSYIDEEGFAEESCKLLFDYAFKELALVKIWTEIYEFDNKKHKLYKELGMNIDGTLRKQYFHDGKWWSASILSILDEEWRYEDEL